MQLETADNHLGKLISDLSSLDALPRCVCLGHCLFVSLFPRGHPLDDIQQLRGVVLELQLSLAPAASLSPHST